MATSRVSEYKLWSVGVVAEHKTVGSYQVLVTPSEHTPVMTGVLKSDPGLVETKGENASGEAYESQGLTDTTIEATWLRESNRVTPPDVRRGTRVELWRLADSDTIYWRDMGMDPQLKRLETVVYAFNNNPDAAGDDTVSSDQSYFLEVSTHSGHMTLYTSKSNGEPYAYTVQINAKEGSISFADDGGNELTFDSAATHIFAKLNTGTEFNLDGNNIYGFAPENITFRASESITMECNQFSLTATESYTCKTSNWFVDAPVGEFTGILMVGGLATTTARGQNGQATIDAELTVKKDFTAEANVAVGGTLSADKVISQQDIEAPNV